MLELAESCCEVMIYLGGLGRGYIPGTRQLTSLPCLHASYCDACYRVVPPPLQA